MSDLTAKSANGNGHHPEKSHAEAEHTEQEHLLNCVEAQTRVEEAVREILINVGEDPDREGLLDTPKRVARMYAELLEGYTKTAEEIIGNALFDVEYGEGEMIVV